MNWITITAGTIIILIFSWFFSIKQKRYHGIPRFFAFESIFILVLLNIRFWFKDPFSTVQVISWILLVLSAYYGIAGFVLLKRKGKPGKDFEQTTVLVKSGIYKYIRHPLYFSLFLLGTGVVLKDPGTVQLVFGAINFIALFFTAKTEEKEMIARFGDDYSQYIVETKMFIPFIV